MNKSHKESALGFLNSVASGQVREAYALYVGAGFKHHNPYFRGDADSLKEGMAQNARKNPNKVLEIQTAIEEGDRVAVFRACVRNRRTRAEPWCIFFASPTGE